MKRHTSTVNYSLIATGILSVILGFLITTFFILNHRAYLDNEVVVPLGDLLVYNSNHTVSPGSVNFTHRRKNKGIKIFCMVLSSLANNGENARKVNNTWGRRCDTLMFLTSRRAKNLNTILLPRHVEDTYDNLWIKVKIGFLHAHSSHMDHDWFVKADDDTYIIMENLRLFLSGYDPSKPMFFGCRFSHEGGVIDRIVRNRGKHGCYMSGGAGYVLSKEALTTFVKDSLEDDQCRDGISDAEDINMGQCLESYDVKFMDSRDNFGRMRFFPMLPFYNGYMLPGWLEHDSWYYRIMYHKPRDGMMDGAAESSLSFHYVPPSFMDIIEFFLYQLSPNQN